MLTRLKVLKQLNKLWELISYQQDIRPGGHIVEDLHYNLKGKTSRYSNDSLSSKSTRCGISSAIESTTL